MANRHLDTVLFLQNNPAGFDAYTSALGAGRVMAGFPVMGGQRDDPVMRVLPFGPVPIPIGEADGSVTDRTRAVAALLERMDGHRVQIRRDMDAWLVTHVPAIGVFLGLYAVEADVERYARTRDARLLGVRAQREALRAQHAAGIPITPSWSQAVRAVPEPVLVAQLGALAPTEVFEVAVAAHARDGREEMAYVLDEYLERVASGGVATPALDRLVAHAHGTAAPLPDGSQEEDLRWGGVAALVGLALGSLVVRRFARRRGR